MGNTDELIDALSSPRRRATVAYLAEHRDGVGLRQLADEIGNREASVDADEEKKRKVRQAVYVALYQSHLPVLEERGIVSTEQRSSGQGGHFVKPGPMFERARSTLDAAEGRLRDGGDSGLADRLRELL